MRADERFWFDLAIIVYVTTKVANSLGIVAWNADKIMDWVFTKQLPRLRAAVSDESMITTPVNILTDYLERINGGTLRTAINTFSNMPSPLEVAHGALLAH